MLIIDSPLHIPMCKLCHAGPDPDFEDLPELVRKSFANCDVYLKEWELPHWDGPTCKGSPVRATIHDEVYTIPNDRVLQKRLGQKWCTIEVKSFEHDASIPENSAGPPPAVMIRCDLPSPNGRGLEPCHIDRFRHEPLLRWDGSYPSFIKAVIDVDTTHYGIFDPSHVGCLPSPPLLPPSHPLLSLCYFHITLSSLCTFNHSGGFLDSRLANCAFRSKSLHSN